LHAACENCNHTKQAPGWRQTTLPSRAALSAPDVVTTTPAGHTYRSRAHTWPGRVGAAPGRVGTATGGDALVALVAAAA